jgi:hypothetical protein
MIAQHGKLQVMMRSSADLSLRVHHPGFTVTWGHGSKLSYNQNRMDAEAADSFWS